MDRLIGMGSQQLWEMKKKDFLNYLTGEVGRPGIINELIVSLRDFGIDAACIMFEDRKESHCATASNSAHTKHQVVPTLNIGIRTYENYYSLNINPRTNNWDSKYPNTDEIRQIWHNLLAKHNYCGGDVHDMYDKKMYIFFSNIPNLVIMRLIYENREAIKNLVKTLCVVQPKEIFCCSTPGYNVIYADRLDYSIAERDCEFDRIRSVLLDEITSETPDEYQHYVPTHLKIEFYHPDMAGFSWYGLSRQD